MPPSDPGHAAPQSFGVAAPPDDGGGSGIFSRPDEELDVSRSGGDPHPDLQYNATTRHRPLRGASWIALVLLLLLFAVPFFWQYLQGG